MVAIQLGNFIDYRSPFTTHEWRCFTHSVVDTRVPES